MPISILNQVEGKCKQRIDVSSIAIDTRFFSNTCKVEIQEFANQSTFRLTVINTYRTCFFWRAGWTREKIQALALRSVLHRRKKLLARHPSQAYFHRNDLQQEVTVLATKKFRLRKFLDSFSIVSHFSLSPYSFF